MAWGCVLVYSTGIVRNELICGYANVVHTSSSFRPRTRTHSYTIWWPWTDGAKSGHCRLYNIASELVRSQFKSKLDPPWRLPSPRSQPAVCRLLAVPTEFILNRQNSFWTPGKKNWKRNACSPQWNHGGFLILAGYNTTDTFVSTVSMPTCHKIPSTPAPLPRQTHSTMIIKFMFVRNQPADNSKRRKEKNEPRRLPTDKPAPMPNTLYSSPKKMHTYLVIKAVYMSLADFTQVRSNFDSRKPDFDRVLFRCNFRGCE